MELKGPYLALPSAMCSAVWRRPVCCRAVWHWAEKSWNEIDGVRQSQWPPVLQVPRASLVTAVYLVNDLLFCEPVKPLFAWANWSWVSVAFNRGKFRVQSRFVSKVYASNHCSTLSSFSGGKPSIFHQRLSAPYRKPLLLYQLQQFLKS